MNIYPDNIKNNSKDTLIKGIEKATEVIKKTYGAAGGNVVIQEKLYPYTRTTNDGKLIVDAIQLENPIEQMGVSILREIADKAEKDSGDGRKTTMILANEILKLASEVKDKSPMEIKRSLDECVPFIIDEIDKSKRLISIDQVDTVATIASENEQIGAVIKEIYKEIGADGIIELDTSNTYDTYYKVKEGVKIRNARYLAQYMVTQDDRAVYKNPAILITKQKISTINDLNPLFTKLTNANRNEIVIYCDDIEPSVLTALAMTHVNGIFRSLVIKAPTLWKNWTFEDFAKMTGATVVEPGNGINLATVEVRHLGTCEKIISSKEDTTLIGIKDISEHVESIKSEGTDESKLRASWLSTKAAILMVGGSSESEIGYNLKKSKDAICASKLALEDGVVMGGGKTLFDISISLKLDTLGNEILALALQKPMTQIIENTGTGFNNGNLIKGNFGYDAKNMEVVDMWESGIIDPALVTKNAVRNAISIAGIVLTATGGAITLNPEETQPVQRMGQMM